MVYQVSQDINAAIPMLVVPAGDISPECHTMMSELCMSYFDVECKNFPSLVEKCNENQINPPVTLRIHPILCETISDLINFENAFLEEQYHYFLKAFFHLVIIDYTINKDAEQVQKNFMEFPGLTPNITTFVIYNASESLVALHSDTTCLCFDTFSRTVTISCIQDFLARTAANAAQRMIVLGITSPPESSIPPIIRISKVKADFNAVAGNLIEATRQIKIALNELESRDAFAWTAAVYELVGILELKERKIMKTQKITLNGYAPSPFPFLNIDSFDGEHTRYAFRCFIFAAGLYNRAGLSANSVDCVIRIFANGSKKAFHPLIKYISIHSRSKGMLMRAWELLNLSIRFNMPRSAGLAASLMAQNFGKDVASDMKLFTLQNILNSCNQDSIVQVRDICMPIIMTYMEERKLPAVLITLISDIMGKIGPFLDVDQQNRLYHHLEENGTDCMKLMIFVLDVKVIPHECNIVKNMSNCTKSDSGSVFLYSYIPDKPNNKKPMIVLVNHVVSVTVTLYNPYGLLLRANSVSLKTDNEFVECDFTTEYLPEYSECVIHCHIKPLKCGFIHITGIQMRFISSTQIIDFENPPQFHAAEHVPRFHLRTDLPLTTPLELYDGEIHYFNMWITNSSDDDITDLQFQFIETETAEIVQKPTLPLLPHQITSVQIKMTAVKGFDYIGITITSSNKENVYTCNQKIRQILNIDDSLSIRRIFMLKTVPPQFTVKLSGDVLFVGYEIENLATSSFHFTAVVGGEKHIGLIGSQESQLMVAHYAISELKSDGKDATKSRVIASTKLMEEQLGKSLTQKQRIKIAKSVSIMQKLESKWDFNWEISNTRKGVLLNKVATIDEELYKGIESRQVRASCSWKLNGEPVTTLVADEMYTLVADYRNEKITKCELDMKQESDCDNGIIWEGELMREDPEGTTVFEYSLCFGNSGEYVFYLNHMTSQGIIGHTPILFTIVNK